MTAPPPPPLHTNIAVTGRVTWENFHLLGFALSEMGTDAQRSAGATVMANIAHLVMCDACQKHATVNAETFQLTEKIERALKRRVQPADPSSLFAVSVDFHNAVNRFLDKKEPTLDSTHWATVYGARFANVKCTACGVGAQTVLEAAPSAPAGSTPASVAQEPTPWFGGPLTTSDIVAIVLAVVCLLLLLVIIVLIVTNGQSMAQLRQAGLRSQ